ncbi:hypothetical protein AVEN_121107-1, partial [Araneus ventricosus]
HANPGRNNGGHRILHPAPAGLVSYSGHVPAIVPGGLNVLIVFDVGRIYNAGREMEANPVPEQIWTFVGLSC